MRSVMIIAILLAVSAIAQSATLTVPGQYSTIQNAINAAANGDTVLVEPGTYVENIDFIGKDITVVSAQGPIVTVIDGGNPINPDYAAVVTFRNGEGPGAMIDGFTLMNGTGSLYSPTPPENVRMGGGVFIKDASPVVKNNIITNNRDIQTSGGGIIVGENSSALVMDNVICCNSCNATGGGIVTYETTQDMKIVNNRIYGNWAKINGGGVSCFGQQEILVEGNTVCGNHAEGDYQGISEWGGGGVYCYEAKPVIMNNYIAHNTTKRKGGGVYCKNFCSPTIKNNFIAGNHANTGGGLDSLNSSPALSCNTILMNSALKNGGGIAARYYSTVIITDCILWDNTAPAGPEIRIAGIVNPSTVDISYSDLMGGLPSCDVAAGCTLKWGSGMIDADPLFTAGPSGFHYLGQDPCQPGMSNPCVDTGSTLASGLGMNAYWTRTDEVVDSGTVDMGFHYGDFLMPALQTDIFRISEIAGGKADMLLLAGSANAGRQYIMLGSVTGWDPGTPLPGGETTLPLNWDIFTTVVVDLLNTSIFANFMGTLDANGSASATFDTLGPVTGAAGITLHFAYALNNPWDFVSNPVGIEIVP